jgi:bifunctional DNA-binding transcriptional regulator/antitoxin component of YhaV-PrlF toxin-antitoxin module
MAMAESVAVVSKSMIDIPLKIRKKYDIKDGDKVIFREKAEGTIPVPAPPLGELAGSASHQKEAILEGIRELERGDRKESGEVKFFQV